MSPEAIEAAKKIIEAFSNRPLLMVKTADQVINEISEVLREFDGKFIQKIANQVLTNKVEYQEDSIFTQNDKATEERIAEIIEEYMPRGDRSNE